MANVHAFASSRPSFTVPAVKRASVWQTAHGTAFEPADNESSGSPAKGLVIAAALGAAMWYGILLLAL